MLKGKTADAQEMEFAKVPWGSLSGLGRRADVISHRPPRGKSGEPEGRRGERSEQGEGNGERAVLQSCPHRAES